MHKIFDIRKFSDTPKCSPTNFFDTDDKNDGGSDTPSLSDAIFSIPEISDSKCSPTKFFGSETETFWTENRDTPPPSYS